MLDRLVELHLERTKMFNGLIEIPETKYGSSGEKANKVRGLKKPKTNKRKHLEKT